MQHVLRLELSFAPDPSRIETTRQAVALCAAVVYRDVAFQEGISMACAELVENAVKYGAAGAESIGLEIHEQRGEVLLGVSNAVDLRSRHPAALRERIDWLHSHPDARSAYLAALTRVYESGDPQSVESGLGIVRVAYEGGSVVECDTDTAGMVIVRARFRRPSGGSPGSAR